MNRPVLIAAFAFFLSVSVPLFAQHGGGHAAGGGGGHAAFGGGHAGGFSGGGAHSFSGARAGSGFAPRSRAFSHPSFGNRSGVGVRIRSYGYGNGYGRNCWGAYGCGSGYGYPYLYGGIDPYWWWENDPNAQPDPSAAYGYDNGLANEMQEQGVPVNAAPDSADQDQYARATPPRAPQQESQAQPGPSTVLVFRDQHQEEVQNYAIVGQTLWNFTSGHTQKIPLTALDVTATQKANDDRGVDFHLPGGSEGQ